MNYTIRNECLAVTVSSLGAEMLGVKAFGKERLWQNENGSWSGHAPVLFPVCGSCGVTVNGKTYEVGAHGFARKSEFALKHISEGKIILSLKSSEETKKKYPFDFVFKAEYALAGNSVNIIYTVENPSDSELPFSCGGHESFALAAGVENYKIVFEKEERLLHAFHGGRGTLTGETRDYGTIKEFPIPADFLTDGATLIFPKIKSRFVELCSLDGEKIAKTEFEDFENLLLWRSNGANMICIEPWGNLPDAEKKSDCEFSQKSGVWKVSPHSQKVITRTVTYF